ncbi:type II toxin-antitoxin system YoeB family toxin [Candidatus Falkowbacteria bacterium]|nr:type II toxin-antitoxin system YoeB family toxin [Candidatus Falkowbacteria bacterium]
MFQLRYTPHFIRRFKKLPKHIQELYAQKEDILKINPFNNKLKSHKLNGKLRDYWSVSIDQKHRFLFRFEGGILIIMMTIGNHDIYNEIL